MLNRRTFITSAAAVSILPLATLMGCGANQSTLAAILTTIGTGLNLTLTNAGLTDLGAKIQSYAQAAANAVKTWIPGSPSQDVVQALNDFLANINLLPTSNQVVLADIQDAIQTIEGLLADFGVTISSVRLAGRAHVAIAVPTKYPSNAKLKAVLADYRARHHLK